MRLHFLLLALLSLLALPALAHVGGEALVAAGEEALVVAVEDMSDPVEAEVSAPADGEVSGLPASAASASAFRPQQLAFPAVAIALGGAGVRSHLIDTRSDRGRFTTIDDQLQYVPIVAYAGLGFIPGVNHRHNFGERFLAGATAYVVMTGMAKGLKHAIREPRPDTDADNSFPSGHTAIAFCGAELTRIEYGNAYGAAAYAFAAATGVLRVVNNRHWCNDVLAGAGIGFLSAHVGYWLLPWEKRVVQRVFGRRGRNRLSANDMYSLGAAPQGRPAAAFCLMPAYDYSTKAPALSFAMQF